MCHLVCISSVLTGFLFLPVLIMDEDVHYVAITFIVHESRQGDVSDVLAVQILEQFLSNAQPYCYCSKSHPARRTTM